MAYNIWVELKPKSKNLRRYPREKGYKIYSQNFLGEYVINHDDDGDEPNKWLRYKCVRSSQLKPSQAVLQRLDEELTQGVVLSYSITATAQQ